MPYTQNWGISRNAFQSPLHDNGEEDNPAANIIKENNIAAESTAVNIPKFIPNEKTQRPEFPADGSDEEKKEWYGKYNEGPVVASASEESTRAMEMGLGNAANLTEEEKRLASGKGQALDYINIAGTAAGMTPAYGAVADAGNTVFSAGRTLTNFIGDTARGISGGGWDYSRTKARATDTGFALAGIIPLAGQMANTGKLAKNVIGKSKGFKTLKADKIRSGVTKTAAGNSIKQMLNTPVKGMPGGPIATIPTSISTFTGKMGSKIASWFQN